MTYSKQGNCIYVTQPSLPALEKYLPFLEKIWDTRILTNNGEFHKEFERELCRYLGVKYVSLFSNGTLAIMAALHALEIHGEVITTPYSFVATTHAIQWNGLKPVFVDIESDYFTLDPAKIESVITSNTSAIMPVHVYGNPCRVREIQKIADSFGLKVIYDACHTFGVTIDGTPVLDFGDLSVLSFHATKVFTTFEGGAVICRDPAMKEKLDKLKNFGFAGETSVVSTGINAKMNEMQAALGLLQLKEIDSLIVKRKEIAMLYRKELSGIKGVRILGDIPGIKHCYSYFPIFIDSEEFGLSRDDLYAKLKNNNIYGRRYFYPLISQFPPYRKLESARAGNLPVAEKITGQVICLPIYPDLCHQMVINICRIIQDSARKAVNL